MYILDLFSIVVIVESVTQDMSGVIITCIVKPL